MGKGGSLAGRKRQEMQIGGEQRDGWRLGTCSSPWSCRAVPAWERGAGAGGDLLQNPLWVSGGLRRGVREELALLKPHLTKPGLQRGSKVKPGAGPGLGT